MHNMDRISQLPDDLLVQILSLVSIEDIVEATSLVSQKWRSLSNLVSRLEYNDIHHYDDDTTDYKIFTQFVFRTLLSNKAPVLDDLYFSLGPKCHALDIGIWIETTMITHRVRQLGLEIWSRSPVSLPRSLFTSEILESLQLRNCSISDVNFCLPSLKRLVLKSVDIAPLPKFLSGCPNLEQLEVLVKDNDKADVIIVAVPCLRSLRLTDARDESKGRKFVIEAPRLEYLKIIDDVVYDSRRIENMPNLVKASVDITNVVTHKFLRALTSARSLYLCALLISEVPSLIVFFYRLVHLEINTLPYGWWDLLTQMLQNSPKLASLELSGEHGLETPSEIPDRWKPPSSIPDSLETFEWSSFEGRQGDLMVVTYLIKKATGLKTATFDPQPCDSEDKYSIVKDLVSVCTPSPTCRLLFK